MLKILFSEPSHEKTLKQITTVKNNGYLIYPPSAQKVHTLILVFNTNKMKERLNSASGSVFTTLPQFSINSAA